MKQNDGGPAFPVIEPNDMSYEPDRFVGMSLRDYFAARAMDSLIITDYENDHIIDDEKMVKWISEQSYKIADAMLKAKGE